VNPLYWGTSQRRLFTLYEPPVAKHGRNRAVVLCQPWGSEYVYAHRAVRQLAVKLAMAGFHSLRFDYFGTGDSGGEAAEADLPGWEADIEAAVDGVRDMVGTRTVALIGLRVGANLAARVARRRPGEIDAVVLWDPIVSGNPYLVAGNEAKAVDWSDRMLAGIRALDLRAETSDSPVRSLVLVTDAAAQDRSEGLATECLPTPCPWVESATTSGVLPVRAIQRIVEWLD
jgi:alpha-beta hydrolase superfamily lysophospholipase